MKKGVGLATLAVVLYVPLIFACLALWAMGEVKPLRKPIDRVVDWLDEAEQVLHRWIGGA